MLGLNDHCERNFGQFREFCLCPALLEAGELDEVSVCFHVVMVLRGMLARQRRKDTYFIYVKCAFYVCKVCFLCIFNF